MFFLTDYFWGLFKSLKMALLSGIGLLIALTCAALAVPDVAGVIGPLLIITALVLGVAFVPLVGYHTVQFNVASPGYLRSLAFIQASFELAAAVSQMVTAPIVHPELGVQCFGKPCYSLGFGVLLFIVILPTAALLWVKHSSRTPLPLGK